MNTKCQLLFVNESHNIHRESHRQMHESYFKMNAKLAYTMGSKNFRSKIPYASLYNVRFVYFSPKFFQGTFFLKFWPYVCLVFNSGFQSIRAGYDGACTVYGKVVGWTI